MDKEAENMDEISSSPAANLDDLIHCDDIWKDEKFTSPCSPSAISEESVMSYASSWCSFSGDSRITYASWCSRSDSEISEIIAPSDQNVDEEIIKVCYRFLNPEADDFGERDEVLTTEIGSSSRLSIRSEESRRPVSGTSSSSTTTAITEAAKMLVSQVIDETVKTLQSTETLRKLHSADFKSHQSRDSHDELLRALPPGPTEDDGHTVFTQDYKKTQNGFNDHNKEETLARRCNPKRKKSLWKRCSSVWQKNRIHPAPVENLDETVRSGSTDFTSRDTRESKQGSSCSGGMSTPLELVDYVEDEDMTPEDIRNVVSSLSSISFIKPDHQVVDVTTDESKDKTRTSSHHRSNDFSDEEEVEETFSQIYVDQSQPASKCLSNNQYDVEETEARKSKGLFSFFHSILSKVRMHLHGSSILNTLKVHLHRL